LNYLILDNEKFFLIDIGYAETVWKNTSLCSITSISIAILSPEVSKNDKS
jgi:hypothetical protein